MRTGCLSCPRKRRLTDLDRTNPYPQVLPTSQKKKRNKTKQKQNKIKAKQSKTKQNKTQQNKTKQNKTKQNKTKKLFLKGIT